MNSRMRFHFVSNQTQSETKISYRVIDVAFHTSVTLNYENSLHTNDDELTNN